MPFISQMLEQVAEKSGLSKSLIVEEAVKKFLRGRLAKDAKALGKLRFSEINAFQFLEDEPDIYSVKDFRI